MNLMVMDVEGTDGRERGEDQVRASQLLCAYDLMQLSLGLRTQISVVLARLVRGAHSQPLGASSWPLSRC